MQDRKELSEALLYNKKTVYQRNSEEQIEDVMRYATGYAAFLNAAKTEREAVREGIRMATSKGFRPYRFGDKIKAGDKLYYNNRDKNLFLFVII